LHNDLEILQKSVPDRIDSLRNLKLNLAEQIRQGERIDPSIYDPEIFTDRIEKLQNESVPENIRRIQAAFTLLVLIIQLDEPGLRKMIRENSFEQEVHEALEILRLNETSVLDANEVLRQRQEEFKKTQETLEALEESVKKRGDVNITKEPRNPKEQAVVNVPTGHRHRCGRG
ncbi:MAG: hypothetical protein LBT08_00765, partial [Synergistaceae bacterium]|jgi:hypothetical protein|nr:hypothetical protein [Synergistaceae bacterium]